MSGIAFIMENSDFSSENIGTIELGSAIENIVDRYISSAGGSASTYRTALLRMVTSLKQENIWDGIDIYPMVGNNLTINLNPTDGKVKANLVYDTDHATMGNNMFTFDGIGPGASSNITNMSGEYIVLPTDSTRANLYVCADVELNENPQTPGIPKNSRFIYGQRNTGNIKFFTASCSTWGDGSQSPTILLLDASGGTGKNRAAYDPSENRLQRRLYSFSIIDINETIDETNYTSETILRVNGAKVTPDNSLGGFKTTAKNGSYKLSQNNGIGFMESQAGASGIDGYYTLDGNVRFFARGVLSQENALKADNIFKTFLESTKPYTNS